MLFTADGVKMLSKWRMGYYCYFCRPRVLRSISGLHNCVIRGIPAPLVRLSVFLGVTVKNWNRVLVSCGKPDMMQTC